MEDNHEIKNNKPVVMTDRGPHGSTRNKSADGEYTASKNGKEIKREVSVSPALSNNDFFHNVTDKDSENVVLDKKVSMPAFFNFIAPEIEKSYGEGAKIEESSRKEDYYQGIDFKLLLDGKILLTADIKTLTNYYGDYKAWTNHECDLTFNLFKIGEKGGIIPGSFLNNKTINTYIFYMQPRSTYTKFELINKLNKGENPQEKGQGATAAYGWLIKREPLEKYIHERILNNNDAIYSIRQDFDFFASSQWLDTNRFKEFEEKGWKRDDSEYLSFSKYFPIYGSNLLAKVVIYRPETGGSQCRMFVSRHLLEDPNLSNCCETYSGQRKLFK